MIDICLNPGIYGVADLADLAEDLEMNLTGDFDEYFDFGTESSPKSSQIYEI
jgi:hypothetical protein